MAKFQTALAVVLVYALGGGLYFMGGFGTIAMADSVGPETLPVAVQEVPAPSLPSARPSYERLEELCASNNAAPASSVDAVLLFQREDWKTRSSLEWVGFRNNKCSETEAKMRYGGSDNKEVQRIRTWAMEACASVAPVLVRSQRPRHGVFSIRSVGRLEARRYSTNGLVASHLVDENTTAQFVELPDGAAKVSSVFFLGETVSVLPGHAYEYLAPQMWSIIHRLGPNRNHSTVAIVVPTLPDGSLSFAMEYYRMIRTAFPEFRWVEVVSDRLQFLSFSRSVTLIGQHNDFRCARLLASLVWPRLRPLLLQRDLPQHRFVALLKLNASGYHFTRRFFSISPRDRDAIRRLYGVVLLNEDTPKDQRLWHTNTAEVFFSSSGANSDITRSFVSIVESKLRVLVEFVHPEAEWFARFRCTRPWDQLHNGDLVRTLAICMNSTTISAADFGRAFSTIRWSLGPMAH